MHYKPPTHVVGNNTASWAEGGHLPPRPTVTQIFICHIQYSSCCTEQLHHILVGQRMSNSHSLWAVLCRFSPQHGIFEALLHISVNVVTEILHCRSSTQNAWLSEIRLLPTTLGENSDQIKMLPDLIHEEIEIELPLATNHHRVRLTCQSIYLLNGSGINLVVHIQASNVLPVTFNFINELINGNILVEDNVGVENLVLLQNISHKALVDTLALLHSGTICETTSLFWFVVNVWSLLVETNTHRLQLIFQQALVY
mmetsp:Transcript_4876/g.18298  ORF Transcript_4876/g.18298 Transcript_4876/m.18298 type:complete len:255 (+) Transcript_4876:669-1433(+)